MSTKTPLPPRIDCHRCVHFYVTWDKHMPFGCRGHGFKSAQLPSQVVFASSGTACLLFQLKPLPKKP